MRTSKSILAGVAASALALGMLSIAGATSASAAPSIKPKAAVNAIVSPVRVTLSGSAVEGVPYASLSWSTSNSLANTDTVVLSIVDAPSPAARIAVATTANVGADATINSSSGVFANALGTTTGYGLGAQMAAAGVVPAYTVAANGTAAIGIAANQAGNYSGTLTSYRGGVALDEVSWAFSTTGKATSMTLTPATQTVSVNGTAALVASLKDANGRATQPLVVDGIATSVSPTGSGSPTAVTTTGSGANSLYDGSAAFTLTPTAAGAYTVTATPIGTLPAGGVTAQSASVTAVGTSAFTGVNVVSPSKGVSSSNSVYTAPVAQTPVASSTLYASTTVKDITFGVVGTPGTLVAYSVTDNVSSPAGVTDGASAVAIGADGTGTFTVTASSPSTTSSYQVAVGPPSGANVTYTIQYSATAALNVGNLKTVPAAGTTTYVKTGAAQSIVATMTDQFGLPLQGVTITATPSVTASASGVTGADGKATLSIAAPASATSQTVTLVGTALGNSTASTTALTLIYNSSGAPTSLTASSTAGTVAQTATALQYVDTAGNKTGAWATTSVTTQTQWMQLTATVGGGVSGVPVAFTGKDVYFTTNTASALGEGDKDLAIAATSGGVASIYVKPTKTGTVTVTMTAGTLTADITWLVANQATDARVISVTPAAQESASPAQVKATVTDAFGNGVANAALNFSEEGVGNFATGTSTLATSTGPNGSVVVDVISSQSGDSTVTVIAGATANYTGAADSPVTGAPKGVSSGVGAIKFGAGSKSITITGSRTTVSGKPGIKIDGAVTGIDNGKTVVPYFRFPGETTFSQGTARPVISGGKFTWERKTGKKFYAYVTSDDGLVKSNRVIIAAN